MSSRTTTNWRLQTCVQGATAKLPTQVLNTAEGGGTKSPMNSKFSLLLLAAGLLMCAALSTGQDLKDAAATADVAVRVNRVLGQYVAVENDFFKLAPRRVPPCQH